MNISFAQFLFEDGCSMGAVMISHRRIIEFRIIFDFYCSINFWIGHWYGSLNIGSEVRESQLVDIFSELSEIMRSCSVKTMNVF
jgi:hypothetical protein